MAKILRASAATSVCATNGEPSRNRAANCSHVPVNPCPARASPGSPGTGMDGGRRERSKAQSGGPQGWRKASVKKGPEKANGPETARPPAPCTFSLITSVAHALQPVHDGQYQNALNCLSRHTEWRRARRRCRIRSELGLPVAGRDTDHMDALPHRKIWVRTVAHPKPRSGEIFLR